MSYLLLSDAGVAEAVRRRQELVADLEEQRAGISGVGALPVASAAERSHRIGASGEGRNSGCLVYDQC